MAINCAKPCFQVWAKVVVSSAERRYAQSLRTLAALVRALPTKKRKGDGSMAPGLEVYAAE